MPDFIFEHSYKDPVAGVDEAGRGPWAGPVVSAAIIINRKVFPLDILNHINDSKLISKKKRTFIFSLLKKLNNKSCFIGIGISNVQEIEQFNILQATLLSMKRAIYNLPVLPNFILIDGKNSPKITIPNKTIIKGDTKSISIAAASIIAKVTRDQIMQNLSIKYPNYDWENNAGYGTKKHQEAIKNFGITIHHRKTFKPIAKLCQKAVNI